MVSIKVGRLIIRNISKIDGTRLSRLLNLKIGKFGFQLGESYFGLHNAGLFSMLSTVASDYLEGRVDAKRIRMHLTGHYYKNSYFQDFWKFAFANPVSNEKLNLQTKIHQKPVYDWWSDLYSQSHIEILGLFVKHFCQPSHAVLNSMNHFMQKYEIDPNKTIAIHYRGTDKLIERELVPFELFINEVHAIKKNDDFQILLLTDDLEVYLKFKSEFGNRLVVIKELPMSTGTIGAHEMKKMNRNQDLIYYLSAVYIASKCEHLITHTGNGGLWEGALRGNLFNFKQIS